LYAIKRPTSENVADLPIARVDPNVPIEDTVGAIAETVKAGYVRYIGHSEVGTVKAGYVRYIGHSEVGATTIRRAAPCIPCRLADRIFPAQESRGSGGGITVSGRSGIGAIAAKPTEQRCQDMP
jgi:aryl-alcohol dehydrogenase-like predicted oxidoreductase